MLSPALPNYSLPIPLAYGTGKRRSTSESSNYSLQNRFGLFSANEEFDPRQHYPFQDVGAGETLRIYGWRPKPTSFELSRSASWVSDRFLRSVSVKPIWQQPPERSGLILLVYYLPTRGEDVLSPPGFQFCNPRYGLLSCLGVIWKATTTD